MSIKPNLTTILPDIPTTNVSNSLYAYLSILNRQHLVMSGKVDIKQKAVTIQDLIDLGLIKEGDL